MRNCLVRLATCLVVLGLSGQSIAAEPAQRAAIAEQKAEVLEQEASSQGNGEIPSVAEQITPPGAQAVDPAGEAPLDDAITCLARTIYWEARGEHARDMESVANVVMNRLGYEGFPDTVCAVVRQGSEQGNCQFSWWCDGRSDSAQEEVSYELAKEIARKALNQQLKDRTGGALYFHHRGVSPGWADEFIVTLEEGDFVFYRPGAGEAR
ncbi:MAG: cell wall hydrolase [Halomonas sp.]|nr:cell wall hydrolase [Halomonas sp.]